MRPRILYIPVFLTLAFGLSLTACKSNKIVKSTPRDNPAIVTLPGYNFRDSGFTRTDFNVYVITTEYGFDSLLVTHLTDPTRPRFDSVFVLAIKAETDQYSYKSTFRSMRFRDDVLNVYFTVNKQEPNDEDFGWVSISTFPRDRGIRLVRFYFDNVLIRTIPVVVVY